MADTADLQSDCARCAALCCIAFPSEKSTAFAATKHAGEPCPKLDQCGQCTIYDTRAENGFSGCLQYECFGAGQRVVQHMFGGQDWRDDQALLPPMIEGFHAARKACELLYLAQYARGQGLDNAETAILEPLENQLDAISKTRPLPDKGFGRAAGGDAAGGNSAGGNAAGGNAAGGNAVGRALQQCEKSIQTLLLDQQARHKSR